MKTVGMTEARQRLGKLVARAQRGERIGITYRRKLVAILEPVQAEPTMEEIFKEIELIRQRTKPGLTTKEIKAMVEEGRR